MKLDFVKMEGLGNDFILVDNRSHLLPDASACSRAAETLCDRHFGIGADGLILIEPGTMDADLSFSIFNSDGSEAEMCGNGMRCFAKRVYETGACRNTEMRIATRAGCIQPRVNLNAQDQVESVTVDMGVPVFTPEAIPFTGKGESMVAQHLHVEEMTFTATLVSMGNPHAVIFVDRVDTVPLTVWGPLIENLPVFPQKTNVEFVEVRSRTDVRMRVWERGAGVTLACGTGACAVLAAGVLENRTEREARVRLPGGDLHLNWDAVTGRMYKTGPARSVFEGVVYL
ncbi:MAG: diaminopimelate epimerase [Deltaproteobacteria bacterium]|nr:MAG: diaminopimelate epimerase [Deltaproteobacteria bacterium]